MPGAVAKSINVNDELGRVQFLFSDKTGTLTVNEVPRPLIAIVVIHVL